jgi:tetratricopeptide (TPR) repeat protein
VLGLLRENALTALILAALTAALTAYLRGVFDAILGDVLPKGAEISCIGREWIADRWPLRKREPTRDVFRILIAKLDRDDTSGTLTQAVVRAFQGQNAIEGVQTCRILRIRGAGPAAEDAVAKTGRKWLTRRNVDVLVFGEVLPPKGETLNLHFLSSDRSQGFAPKSFGFEAGLLKDDFSEAAAGQFQAIALAAVSPVTDQRGRYLVETLRPVARRLERIVRSPPPGMSTSGMADAQFAFALAMSTIGEQAGDNLALEEAEAAYRAALEERTRDRVPLDWAMTQNALGNALQALGARESGTARLEEAAAAYRSALEEYTRQRVPLDWAMTQNNLGTALYTLGERESGTARLEEAVVAYRAALEERTRDRVPLDWAMTQTNLGSALSVLGERESGAARLEEAVAAYRAALTEYTRHRVPLDWAGTQSNLGNALLMLGERESGAARLEEAVAAYRAALTEYTRHRMPLDWAMTQNNLGNALQTLGVRESGTARLEEAVAAYRSALEERTRDRVPLDWAMSTGNQGVALMVIAERIGDSSKARAAVEQIEAALATMREGGHDPFAASYEAQLPLARALLDRLAGG